MVVCTPFSCVHAVQAANEAMAGIMPMRMKAGRKQSPVGLSSWMESRAADCSMALRSARSCSATARRSCAMGDAP